MAQSFVGQLTDPQKAIFRKLRKLLGNQNLVWRHSIGSAIIELENATPERSKGWFENLAESLEQSTSNLRKQRQFAKDYTVQEAEALDRQKCTWGWITVVLHIDKEDALTLIAEGRKNGLNLDDLKYAVKDAVKARFKS